MQSFSWQLRPLVLPRRGGAVRILLVAAVTVLWAAGSIGVASAQYVTPEPPVAGAPTDVQTSPVVDAANPAGGATAQVATRSSGSGLPVTGGDIVGLTAIGLGAIAAGGLALHARRRAARG